MSTRFGKQGLFRDSILPSTIFQLLLLFALNLAAYSPSLFGEYSRVDDQALASSLRNSSAASIKQIFVPNVRDGAYYRPVLAMSYRADRLLFDLEPGLMHVQNILFHILNTILVFWLARQLTPTQEGRKRFIPLLSALLFGLHPINTESVNWISGRTDILAGTLVLLSVNLLFFFRRHRSPAALAGAAVSLFLGFLTKEVAVAFLAGAFLILIARKDKDDLEPTKGSKQTDTRSSEWKYILMIAGVIGAFVLYLTLRSAAFVSTESRFGWTLAVIASQPFYALFVFLGALGFYVKKLILPFPLNFAITTIDPLYEIFGILLVVLCIYLVSRRSNRSAVLLAGLLLLAPAFPLALGKIAWTPYAERYAYLPSAFVTVALASYAADLLKRVKGTSILVWKAAGVGLLIALAAIGTVQRSVTWMHNESLLRDTVEKSHSFPPVLIDYAFVLAENGDLRGAREHLMIAASYDHPEFSKVISSLFRRQFGSAGDIDFGFAYLSEQEGKPDKAIEQYKSAFRRSHNNSLKTDALGRIVRLYGDKLRTADRHADLTRLKKEIATYGEKLYKFNGDPYILYVTGKFYLIRGERAEAAAFLRMAHDRFPEGSEYRRFTKKLTEGQRES